MFSIKLTCIPVYVYDPKYCMLYIYTQIYHTYLYIYIVFVNACTYTYTYIYIYMYVYVYLL